MLGLVPGTANVVCAYGHVRWGILWAPVTGLLISELIADGSVKAIPPSGPVLAAAVHAARARKGAGPRGDERSGSSGALVGGAIRASQKPPGGLTCPWAPCPRRGFALLGLLGGREAVELALLLAAPPWPRAAPSRFARSSS